MKEYLKPELEYIEFCVEAITTSFGGGITGEGELPPGAPEDNGGL